MTPKIDYTPRPHHTMDEIEALVAFIEARIEPLRVAAEFGSEERAAFGALLNLVAYMEGGAQSAVQAGDDPRQFHSLAVVARGWAQHPDFQSAWAWDAL